MTAIPFFLSKLQNTPNLRATFTSYLSVTYMISNFVALAYCTITTGQADNTLRIRASSAILFASFCLLAISPALPMSEGTFYSFVILNGIIQSCAGAFLATAVIAVGALFGPPTLAALFTGHGLVGAFIAAVQYASAAWTFHPGTLTPASSVTSALKRWLSRRDDPAGDSADLSLYAFAFFGFAAFFTALAVGAHASLVRTPLYNSVALAPRSFKTVTPFEADDDEVEEGGAGVGGLENQPFLSLSMHEDQMPTSEWRRVIELCSINMPYNFAVAWALMLTLVGLTFRSRILYRILTRVSVNRQ